MGNYRFRLSDMIPNAWFHKLKYMKKPKNHPFYPPTNKIHHRPSPPKSTSTTSTTTSTNSNTNTNNTTTTTTIMKPSLKRQTNLSLPRKSYYFSSDDPNRQKLNSSPPTSSAHFPNEPPRKSKRIGPRKRPSKSSPRLTSCSVSTDCGCRASFTSPPSASTTTIVDDDRYNGSIDSCSSPCNCRLSSSTTDIVVDVENKPSRRLQLDVSDSASVIDLPPILTRLPPPPPKLKKQTDPTAEKPCFELQVKNGNAKKSSSSSSSSPAFQGVKLRANSPRLASKKIQAYSRKSNASGVASMNSKTKQRKSVCESFAVVKSSFDPQRDFRDSMVEMIVENNIRGSKDLEDLLACYLSLNSNEYHDVIVKVFEQIWIDLTHL